MPRHKVTCDQVMKGNLLIRSGQLAYVYGIHPAGGHLHDGRKWVPIEVWEPVQLTWQFRMKVGWRTTLEETDWSAYLDGKWGRGRNNLNNYSFEEGKIVYLHQLQNLMTILNKPPLRLPPEAELERLLKLKFAEQD